MHDSKVLTLHGGGWGSNPLGSTKKCGNLQDKPEPRTRLPIADHVQVQQHGEEHTRLVCAPNLRHVRPSIYRLVVHICEHVAVGVEGCVDAGVAHYLLHDFSALSVPKHQYREGVAQILETESEGETGAFK